MDRERPFGHKWVNQTITIKVTIQCTNRYEDISPFNILEIL